MIVIARNFGQLGNRLALAANLIAAAEEYQVPLLNPSFAEYASYFRSTANDLWCRYPALQPDESRLPPASLTRSALYRTVYLAGRTMSHLRLTQFPFHVIRLGHEGTCDLTSDEFAQRANSRRPLLVSGWRFDSGHLMAKHADQIREHFRILPQHEDQVEALHERIRRPGQVVVGVHIRHGDYAKFRGGKYFYSLHQYVAAMHRIRRNLTGQDVTFLVCGNTKLTAQDFGDLDVHFGTGHLVEDMYSFAKCDHLVGPPSTYTGWASFYGDVPLHRMMSPTDPFHDFYPGSHASSKGCLAMLQASIVRVSSIGLP